MSSQNCVRKLSTMEITKYMQLFTEQPYKIDKDPKTLKYVQCYSFITYI